MVSEGVVKEFPVPIAVPPVLEVYHLIVFVPEAERVTAPGPHIELSFASGLDGVL